MSHYRKIDTRIWLDEKFMALSDNAKFLFLYILTHPAMTSLGAMRATLGGISDELKWQKIKTLSNFKTLSGGGLLKFNQSVGLLVVINFIRYNRPANPKMIKKWGTYLELLPECEDKNQLIQSLAAYIKDNFDKPFVEALPIPFRNSIVYSIENSMAYIESIEHRTNNINNNSLVIERDIYTARAEKIEVSEKTSDEKIFALPAKTEEYIIFQAMLTQWQKNYPAVDVMFELQKMKEWLLENNLLSIFKMPAFVNKWLCKEQGKGAKIHTINGHGENQNGSSYRTNYAKKPSAFEIATSSQLNAQWAK